MTKNSRKIIVVFVVPILLSFLIVTGAYAITIFVDGFREAVWDDGGQTIDSTNNPNISDDVDIEKLE